MKHLGNVLICGAAYPVIEGNSSDDEGMDGNHGYCKVTERQLWIHDGLTPSKKDDIITHEVLHAINADSGVMYAIAAALGLKSDDNRLDDCEEMIVRILTPNIRAAFGPPKLGHAPKKGRKRGKRAR
jgi:hypothetical protein